MKAAASLVTTAVSADTYAQAQKRRRAEFNVASFRLERLEWIADDQSSLRIDLDDFNVVGRDAPFACPCCDRPALAGTSQAQRSVAASARSTRVAMPQGAAKDSNLGKAIALAHDHIWCVRNMISAQSAGASSEWRTTVKTRIKSAVHGTVRWALLPAIAMSAMLVSLPAAKAFDQQATTAEMDDALNWQAAEGYRNAYARAPYEFGHKPRHHREHRGY
jgi:hypothetical protein